jgi:hypothetical protein
MELPMLHPQLELALNLIGVDLSKLTLSQRTFLIDSTARLLRKHDLQWIKESRRLLRDRFDLLKKDLEGGPPSLPGQITPLFAPRIDDLTLAGRSTREISPLLSRSQGILDRSPHVVPSWMHRVPEVG